MEAIHRLSLKPSQELIQSSKTGIASSHLPLSLWYNNYVVYKCLTIWGKDEVELEA